MCRLRISPLGLFFLRWYLLTESKEHENALQLVFDEMRKRLHVMLILIRINRQKKMQSNFSNNKIEHLNRGVSRDTIDCS